MNLCSPGNENVATVCTARSVCSLTISDAGTMAFSSFRMQSVCYCILERNRFDATRTTCPRTKKPQPLLLNGQSGSDEKRNDSGKVGLLQPVLRSRNPLTAAVHADTDHARRPGREERTVSARARGNNNSCFRLLHLCGP